MDNNCLNNDNEVVNLIVKTAGNLCNISCTYCFEQVKDIEAYSLIASDLKKAIDQIEKQCTVVFHGGEPLIVGQERFKEYLNIVRDYFPHKVKVVRIQTNGTLLDEDWIGILFNEYKDLKIEIAISLDGTEIMNQYRVDHSGSPTYYRILSAFELLHKYGKTAGMLSVISKPAIQSYKAYVELIESIPNISFVKVNALFNVVDNRLTENSITPIEYAEFVLHVSEEYIKRGLYRRFVMEPFLSILQRLNNKPSKYCNYSNRKCFNYISLYPNGSFGPCDCLSINSFYIGNIYNNFSINEQTKKYLDINQESELKLLLKECKNCEIEDFCQGGCLSQRYYFRHNEGLIEDFCKSKYFLYNEFRNLLSLYKK